MPVGPVTRFGGNMGVAPHVLSVESQVRGAGGLRREVADATGE